jgi:2-phosphosulfolactate phosphatase
MADQLPVEVILLPAVLDIRGIESKTVVVFDVLRATSTIISGLAAGVRSFRAFANLDDAKAATAATTPRPILIGELHALPAPGVDLGNSPRQWLPEHAGRDAFMATTNGTKAMNAARNAAGMFLGALLNASAVAKTAGATRRPILLLCSGTDGQICVEDTLGAGAVACALEKQGYTPANDSARLAYTLFRACKENLVATVYDTQGARNNIKVGLNADIDFVARLDVYDFAPVVRLPELVITRG